MNDHPANSPMRAGQLDHTTLHGALDALGLVDRFGQDPLTPELVMTLAHFVDLVVLQDEIFYEDDPHPSFDKYLELIGESRIADRLGCDSERAVPILRSHRNDAETEGLIADAMSKALDSVDSVPEGALKWAVDARGSVYRKMSKVKHVHDCDNPSVKLYQQVLFDSGDSKTVQNYHRVLQDLERRDIGPLGLHILARLFLIESWLSKAPSVSYVPHLSRGPLTAAVLRGSERPQFHVWWLEQVKARRKELVEGNYGTSEFTESSLEMSPIFLACLSGARAPLDILENALELRAGRHARAFRASLRAFGNEISTGSVETITRARVRKALRDLDEEILVKTWRRLVGQLKVSWNLFRMEPSASVGGDYTVKSLLPGTHTSRALALTTDVLTRAASMLNVESEIERVFGLRPSNFTFYLLSRVPHRRPNCNANGELSVDLIR